MADAIFRDTVAHDLTKLYGKLASAAYFSPTSIQNPPPGGWEDAQLDMSGLLHGKTNAVIDLVRHLPFLQPVRDVHWPVHPKTLAVSYLLPSNDLTAPEVELLGRLPPHVISLTRGGINDWNPYGPTWWLVDCQEKHIKVYSGPPAALEDRWRACPSLDPVEVFEDATSKLDYSYLPVPAVHGVQADIWARDRPDREFDAVAEIYRNHGWPEGNGQEFRRHSCRAKLKALMVKKRDWEQRKPAMESARRIFQQQYPQFQSANISSPTTGYNRDALVAAITCYYETLSKMAWFLPKLIQYPPPGGWSDRNFLPEDKLRLLGFNDRVVDLLRHMPYIDIDEENDEIPWPVYLDNSVPERYLSDNPQLTDDLTEENSTPESLHAHSISPWPQPMPSGLVPLAGGRYATWWVVDTNTGDMILFDRMKEVSSAPDDQPWLWRRPRPAVQFFDTLCSKLMSLDLVPVPRPDIEEEGPSIWGGISDDWEQNGNLFDLTVEDARDIYRAHGWPNVDNFDRDTCYDALAELHERYCDEVLDSCKTPEDLGEEEVA